MTKRQNSEIIKTVAVSPSDGRNKKKCKVMDEQPVGRASAEDPPNGWNVMFDKLVKYKNDNGFVPKHNFKDDPELGNWVSTQRADYSKKKLSDEKVHKLKSVGLVWNAISMTLSFDEMCEILVNYKNEHNGHCLVPTMRKEDPKLVSWVDKQRRCKRLGTLSPCETKKLEAMGFAWVGPRALVDISAEQTMTKKEVSAVGTAAQSHHISSEKTKMKEEESTETESCYTSIAPHPSYPAPAPPRNAMKKRQKNSEIKSTVAVSPSEGGRNNKKCKVMDEHPVERAAAEALWNVMFEKLVKFKDEKNGNGFAPKHNFKDDPELGNWVFTQRADYKLHKLSGEKVAKLESVGFVWSVGPALEESFDFMFRKLVKYKVEKNGNCLLPKYYFKDDPKLDNWVSKQRTEYKKKNLSEERVNKLGSAGMVWNVSSSTLSFNEMCERLVNYRDEHGHCLVPTMRKEDPKLARFVDQQRSCRRLGALWACQIKKLDAMGFAWIGPNALVVVDTSAETSTKVKTECSAGTTAQSHHASSEKTIKVKEEESTETEPQLRDWVEDTGDPWIV